MDADKGTVLATVDIGRGSRRLRVRPVEGPGLQLQRRRRHGDGRRRGRAGQVQGRRDHPHPGQHRTMALDPKTHRLYLSAATAGPAPPETSPRPREAGGTSCRTPSPSSWSIELGSLNRQDAKGAKFGRERRRGGRKRFSLDSFSSLFPWRSWPWRFNPRPNPRPVFGVGWYTGPIGLEVPASRERTMRVLSGIQPSGALHIGNYFGAIRQYIDLQAGNDAFYFVADYHALTSVRDAAKLRGYVFDVDRRPAGPGARPRAAPRCSSSPTCPRRPSWPGC